MKKLFMLVVFLTLFCTVPVLALDAPTLTVTTSGVNVSLSWTSVPGVTGYFLHYAPNPYTGPSSIATVDMGIDTTISTDLWAGASYYVAITAHIGNAESEYSNVGLFTIDNGTVPTVTSAEQVWMDRNLGAFQVASSPTDSAAYGDLYQWGRGADGHQLRNSFTTTTSSSADDPDHGNFITSEGPSYYDWRVPQNDNLWQDTSGANNPCPAGFRLPTYAEWETELASWTSNDTAGAFASPLKLVVAGDRHYRTAEAVANVGVSGYYWSSGVLGSAAYYLSYGSHGANMSIAHRASGYCVRCIKD